MVRQRVRIRFCKQGDLRFIGHRDLIRCMERLFRRAGLSLGMSQGFHPKPRMTFPSALALGIEATDEVMEVELAQRCTADDLQQRLVPLQPAGLSIKSIEVLPEGSRKAQVKRVSYQIPIPRQHQAGLAERVERLMAATSHVVQRPGRSTPVDLCEFLDRLTLDGDVLGMRLQIGRRAGASPRDVLAALGLDQLEHEGAHLTRTAVEILP